MGIMSVLVLGRFFFDVIESVSFKLLSVLLMNGIMVVSFRVINKIWSFLLITYKSLMFVVDVLMKIGFCEMWFW